MPFGRPMASHRREFLALPVTGAGMTATLVTAGPGTPALNSIRAGRQRHTGQGLGLPHHGPGSRPSLPGACCAQGEEELRVPGLRLRGDCPASRPGPPGGPPRPTPLASPSACAGRRGKFPGQPCLRGGAWARFFPGVPPPSLSELVEGVWLENVGESPSPVPGVSEEAGAAVPGLPRAPTLAGLSARPGPGELGL